MEAVAALSFTGTSELAEVALEPLGVRPTATEGEPAESIRRLHEDAGGEFGVWECQPGRFPTAKDGVSELMHVISGHARVHGSDGSLHELRAGDTFLAPDGWSGEWELLEPTRKLYVLWKTRSAE
ncbi:MAG: cupin domain-containing protein [Solirubrobacterales bacterium]